MRCAELGVRSWVAQRVGSGGCEEEKERVRVDA